MGLHQELRSPGIGLAIKFPALPISSLNCWLLPLRWVWTRGRQAAGSISVQAAPRESTEACLLHRGFIEAMVDTTFLPGTWGSHGSKSDPPISPHFPAHPSVPGRPLLMVCDTGTSRPSLANLTTVWCSCPLQRLIDWLFCQEGKGFVWATCLQSTLYTDASWSFLGHPAPHNQAAWVFLFQLYDPVCMWLVYSVPFDLVSLLCSTYAFSWKLLFLTP